MTVGDFSFWAGIITLLNAALRLKDYLCEKKSAFLSGYYKTSV